MRNRLHEAVNFRVLRELYYTYALQTYPTPLQIYTYIIYSSLVSLPYTEHLINATSQLLDPFAERLPAELIRYIRYI